MTRSHAPSRTALATNKISRFVRQQTSTKSHAKSMMNSKPYQTDQRNEESLIVFGHLEVIQEVSLQKDNILNQQVRIKKQFQTIQTNV